jgi:hypothetical protein
MVGQWPHAHSGDDAGAAKRQHTSRQDSHARFHLEVLAGQEMDGRFHFRQVGFAPRESGRHADVCVPVGAPWSLILAAQALNDLCFRARLVQSSVVLCV